ncbi:armadillo-type protein [Mycena leptocephala]|nr:armadillo-type protein [Mycena leptocephala]
MHPLTRQPTLDSVRSWWSDSNPTGPNINLHAASKPLMWLMYHRAATNFIAKNRGTTLSNEDMEIYSSYLVHRYPHTDVLDGGTTSAPRGNSGGRLVCEAVPTTGIPLAVLIETSGSDIEVIAGASQALCWIAVSPEGAQALVDADLLDCVATLFQSPKKEVREWASEILGSWHATSPQRGGRGTCGIPLAASFNYIHLRQLLIVISGENLSVVGSAARTLYLIALSPERAKAAVDANILQCVAELSESPNEEVRKYIFEMLRELAHHEPQRARPWDSWYPSYGESQLYLLYGLLIFISGENLSVIEDAAKALYWIATQPGGAQVAVAANVLRAELLESPNEEVRKWRFNILRELVHHGPTAGRSWDRSYRFYGESRLYLWGDLSVIEGAAKTLCRIAATPDGAQAVVDVDVLDSMPQLLNSSNDKFGDGRGHARRDGKPQNTTLAVLDLNRGTSQSRRECGQDIVSDRPIAGRRTSSRGCQCARLSAQLLNSSNNEVWRWTWDMLAELVRHKSTVRGRGTRGIPLARGKSQNHRESGQDIVPDRHIAGRRANRPGCQCN